MDTLGIATTGLFILSIISNDGSAIQWTSKATFNETSTDFLEVNLESSRQSALVQGGDTVIYNVSISYRRENLNNDVERERLSAYESYCQYVKEMQNTTLFSGGESFLNCTNITRIVVSNFTCNSSDGINCAYNNLTDNSTFFPNGSSINYTLITKTVEKNVTSLQCVNSTTPLVPYKPDILPASYFNLTYNAFDIEVELPEEFNIDEVEDLVLSRKLSNVTTDCTEHVVNSSYTKDVTNSRVMFQLYIGNVSWNGFILVSASVTERVMH